VHLALQVREPDLVADANDVRLGGNTAIADIDIVTTGGEILTGKNLVRCLGCRVLLTSDAGAGIEVTVVLRASARSPSAVLWFPVVLLRSAAIPSAVLWNPELLLKSAPAPVAAFWNPVVLLKSAPLPRAVLKLPVVRLWSALAPSAVLPLG
jgi:hypothetical protein